jgi:hypothetical protein
MPEKATATDELCQPAALGAEVAVTTATGEVVSRLTTTALETRPPGVESVQVISFPRTSEATVESPQLAEDVTGCPLASTCQETPTSET